MDVGFGLGGSTSSGAVNPVQHASPIAEGGTVVAANGQNNASILLDPSGPRNLVYVQLPSPPKDGQILTIGSSRSIQMVQFIPNVPSSPNMWDVGDAFQVKWFDALNSWVLLK